MSIRMMTRVWDSDVQGQGRLLVLLALADYANDAGECWPAIKSISKKARMTERGVQKIVRDLEADGWLKVDTGNGRSGCNRYTINPERSSPPNVVHPERRCTETPNVDVINPERSSPEPSRTINEPSIIDNGRGDDAVSAKPSKHRLPEGWVPSLADREYALSHKLTDAEIKEIADDFHAYWTDRTDAGGRKSERGWAATWRNRVRDQAPRFIRNRFLAGKQQAAGHGRGGGVAGEIARRRFGG